MSVLAYNHAVRQPLSRDTSPEIEQRQVDGWRRMTPADKASLIDGLTRAAVEMTLAGIRHRFPNEHERQHRLRLVAIMHGPELARRAYPELADLDPA